MKDLMIIDPFCPEESKKERLEKIVTHSVGDYSYERLTTVEQKDTVHAVAGAVRNKPELVQHDEVSAS